MVHTAIITAISLAVLTAAAPSQKRDGLIGAYSCPQPAFVRTDAMDCRWKATSNETAGTCKHLQWFGMKNTDQRHISFAPDAGNFCTLFDDLSCDKSKPYYAIAEPEGVTDVFLQHQLLFGNTTAQFLSYMCSTVSLDDSTNQPVTHVDGK
jgi:hypothetical protein